MLVGLIEPTSGSARINGYDLKSQMRQIRQSIGVCMQSNILFDTMTVREHLRLFATLKGVTKNLKIIVESQIDEIGLRDKADVYSAALSGGMKRKLSVGIVLIL